MLLVAGWLCNGWKRVFEERKRDVKREKVLVKNELRVSKPEFIGFGRIYEIFSFLTFSSCIFVLIII